jgi:hypothetical protein
MYPIILQTDLQNSSCDMAYFKFVIIQSGKSESQCVGNKGFIHEERASGIYSTGGWVSPKP